GEHLLGDLTVDVELETLALAHRGDPLEAQARQSGGDGLPLRVEDLRLRHDVDHDAWHGHSPGVEGAAGCRRSRAGAVRPGRPSGGPRSEERRVGKESIVRRWTE